MYLTDMSNRSRTPFVILGLLCYEPMSGYALKATIAATVGHFWQESYGQLFPTLKALNDDGLVALCAQSVGGRVRKVYAITPAGRAALFAWLAEPPQASPVRNELLLKVFLASMGTADDLRAHLLTAQREARAQIAALSAIRNAVEAESATEHQRRCWLLTVDFGLRGAEGALAWAEQALADLPEAP